MTENQKNELAEACGWAEDRRVDRIKERIAKSPYDKEEENALKRKAIMAILNNIVDGTPIPEKVLVQFTKYFNDIEAIKEEVDGA